MLDHAACYNWPTLRDDLAIDEALPSEPIARIELKSLLSKDSESMKMDLFLIVNDDQTIYLQPQEETEEIKGGQGRPAKAIPSALKIGDRIYRAHWREHEGKPSLSFMSEIEGEKFIKMPKLALWSKEKRDQETKKIANKIITTGLESLTVEEKTFLNEAQKCV
jgi:hypothetical protein